MPLLPIPRYPYSPSPNPSHPFLLPGYARNWGAMSWTWEYLASMARANPAVVSVSRSEEEVEETKREEEELEAVFRAIPASVSTSASSFYYLKQCDLFSLLPQLSADIPWSCLSGLLDHPLFLTPRAWAGRGGSVTGTHWDDEKNVLVQLKGTKRVILSPPSSAPFLGLNSKYDAGTVCADVDLRALAEELRTKKAREVGGDEKESEVVLYEAILQPGDALYIPMYWFHHVSTPAHSPSLSLNFFASSFTDCVMQGVPRAWFEFWHLCGIYGIAGGCVCHPPTSPPSLTTPILLLITTTTLCHALKAVFLPTHPASSP